MIIIIIAVVIEITIVAMSTHGFCGGIVLGPVVSLRTYSRLEYIIHTGIIAKFAEVYIIQRLSVV